MVQPPNAGLIRDRIIKQLDRIGIPLTWNERTNTKLFKLLGESLEIQDYHLAVRILLCKSLLKLEFESIAAVNIRIAMQCLDVAPKPTEVEKDLLQRVAEQTAVIRHAREGITSWDEFRHVFATEYAHFQKRLRHLEPSLSPVEIRVSMLLAKDYSTSAITRMLAMSDKTLFNHRGVIRKKLRLSREHNLQTMLSSLLWEAD
ncbi:MAG TPA: hypothetical protein VEF04_08500 [Blastocatellia bacterium]|nr:hypothetical protein [Blastocatellia bacterium]